MDRETWTPLVILGAAVLGGLGMVYAFGESRRGDATATQPRAGPVPVPMGILHMPLPSSLGPPFQVSSGYHYRINPVTHEPEDHKGLDLPAPEGTPVFAVESGVIRTIYHDGEGRGAVNGNAVAITGESGVTWYFLHLSRFAPIAVVGNRVPAGMLIGFVGHTGRATGSHLHLQGLYAGAYFDPSRLFPPGTFTGDVA
jgi:murein DD-endopeptidase MepM/ murein hydrolase activator NlpD